jgi:hypothetical protein
MAISEMCSCCKKKLGNGEKMNDLCVLVGCKENECKAPEGTKEDCMLVEKINGVWDVLREKDGVLQQKLDNCQKTKGFQVETSGGRGTGNGVKWCHWVTVKGAEKRGVHFIGEKREAMEIEYTLTFRLDNYCPDNHFHLYNCLFNDSSGNSCEIRHIGYIQFVETKNKYDDNPSTASFNENGKWVFPDNENPNTGRVAPLYFCDAPPVLLWKDGAPKRHVHVLDFYDNNGKGKLNADMVDCLATAFVKWIEGLQP